VLLGRRRLLSLRPGLLHRSSVYRRGRRRRGQVGLQCRRWRRRGRRGHRLRRRGWRRSRWWRRRRIRLLRLCRLRLRSLRLRLRLRRLARRRVGRRALCERGDGQPCATAAQDENDRCLPQQRWAGRHEEPPESLRRAPVLIDLDPSVNGQSMPFSSSTRPISGDTADPETFQQDIRAWFQTGLSAPMSVAIWATFRTRSSARSSPKSDTAARVFRDIAAAAVVVLCPFSSGFRCPSS
jgi:hypothetical protein